MLKLEKTNAKVELNKRCWHDIAKLLYDFENMDGSVIEITNFDDYPSVNHCYKSIWCSIKRHKKNKSIAIAKRNERLYLMKLI